MKKRKYLLPTVLLIFFSPLLFAGDGTQSTVGKFMRSDERSYVVIAVMLVIFLGLILYLVRLEKKIKKLEKGK